MLSQTDRQTHRHRDRHTQTVRRVDHIPHPYWGGLKSVLLQLELISLIHTQEHLQNIDIKVEYRGQYHINSKLVSRPQLMYFWQSWSCRIGLYVVIELLKVSIPSSYYMDWRLVIYINESQIKSLNFVLNSAFRKTFLIKSIG